MVDFYNDETISEICDDSEFRELIKRFVNDRQKITADHAAVIFMLNIVLAIKNYI